MDSGETVRLTRPRAAVREWFRDSQTTWLHTVLDSIARSPPGRLARVDRARPTRRLAASAIAFAACCYLLGLAGAWLGGFFTLYLETDLVYVVAFGIAWVSFWGGWADERLRAFRRELKPAFAVESEFSELYRGDLRRLFSRTRHLGWTAVGVSALWIYIAYAVYLRGAFTIVSDDWAHDSRAAKMLVLWWLVVPSVALTATMLTGAADFARIVQRLARLRMALPPELARARLRPLITWGMSTGFGWVVGLALVIALFRFVPGSWGETPRGPYLIGPVAFFTFAAVWGAVCLLLIPQYVLSRAFRRARAAVLAAWAARLAEFGQTRNVPEHHVQLLLTNPRYEHAERITRELAASPEFAFSFPGGPRVFFSGVVLPLVGLVVSVVAALAPQG